MVSNRVMLNALYATAAALAVGAATFSAYKWFQKEQWDEDTADSILKQQLQDLYDEALITHPDNKANSDLYFQWKAKELKDAFYKDNHIFPEYNDWIRKFDEKVKNYRHKIQKN